MGWRFCPWILLQICLLTGEWKDKVHTEPPLVFTVQYARGSTFSTHDGCTHQNSLTSIVVIDRSNLPIANCNKTNLDGLGGCKYSTHTSNMRLLMWRSINQSINQSINVFIVDKVGSGRPISRARGSCKKRSKLQPELQRPNHNTGFYIPHSSRTVVSNPLRCKYKSDAWCNFLSRAKLQQLFLNIAFLLRGSNPQLHFQRQSKYMTF